MQAEHVGFYLQQLVAHSDASVASGRPPGCDPHYENAHAWSIPISGQAESQAVAIFLQLHDQQFTWEVRVPLPDHL